MKCEIISLLVLPHFLKFSEGRTENIYKKWEMVNTYLSSMTGVPASLEVGQDLMAIVDMLGKMEGGTNVEQTAQKRHDFFAHDPWLVAPLLFPGLGLPFILAPAVVADIVLFTTLVKLGSVKLHTLHTLINRIKLGIAASALAAAGTAAGTAAAVVGGVKAAGAVKGIAATKAVEALHHWKYHHHHHKLPLVASPYLHGHGLHHHHHLQPHLYPHVHAAIPVAPAIPHYHKLLG